MNYITDKHREGIITFLIGLVEEDDKRNFRLLVERWEKQIEIHRDSDRDWANMCIEIANELAPEGWLK